MVKDRTDVEKVTEPDAQRDATCARRSDKSARQIMKSLSSAKPRSKSVERKKRL